MATALRVLGLTRASAEAGGAAEKGEGRGEEEEEEEAQRSRSGGAMPDPAAAGAETDALADAAWIKQAAAMLGPRYDQASAAERALHKGFCEMRFLHSTASWDTLDDVDTDGIKCLQDLYERVIGPALQQPLVIGKLDTGGVSLTGAAASHWSNCRGVHFPGHDQVWQVRSTPKGRIGKPIQRDEVRQVAVLVRPAQRSSVALISTFRLHLLQPLAAVANVASRRGSHTYAALGVPIVGLHIFSHHGREELKKERYLEGKAGHHVVLGNYATLQEQAPYGPLKGEWLTQRIAEGINHPIVIAAHLDGLSIADEPMNRPGVEAFPGDKWIQAKLHMTARFTALICARHEGQDIDAGSFAQRLIHGATGIAEQCSFVGILDMIADPFFEGAMPNELHEPCGLPLLMAMAVRIACHPHRFGLEPGTSDDHWACREARHLLESVQQPVMARDADTGRPSNTDESTFAMDIVINHTMSVLTDCMERIDGRASQAAAIGVTTKGRKAMKVEFRESLEMLRRAGVGVCIDVCSVAPRQADGLSGIYTQYGLAQSCCDPIEQSRFAAAYDCGLGDLEPFCPPLRTSTRGARQMALVRVLTAVEQWLATGTYNNIAIAPSRARPGHQAFEPHVDRVDVRCETDCAGNVTNVTMHKPAPQPALGASAGLAAAAGAHCSNRKKQRGASRRVTRAMRAAAAAAPSAGAADEQAMDAAVASAHRRRQDLLRDAIESSSTCSERLRSNSLDQATELLGDALQMGLGFATSTFFDCQTFVVGMASGLRCAHCHRWVNVVENIAFAGKLGACVNCQRPRCLHCVYADIDIECRRYDREQSGEAPSDDEDADSIRNVPGRALGGCLFCSGDAAHAVPTR